MGDPDSLCLNFSAAIRAVNFLHSQKGKDYKWKNGSRQYWLQKKLFTFTYFIILSTIQYYNTIPFLNRNTVTHLGLFIIMDVTCASVIIVIENAMLTKLNFPSGHGE